MGDQNQMIFLKDYIESPDNRLRFSKEGKQHLPYLMINSIGIKK